MLLRKIVDRCTCRYVSTSATNFAKQNLSREGRFMRKLLRRDDSQKKWYPHKAPGSSIQFQLPSNKNNVSNRALRRVKVLNKLFMKHITDLMSTEDVSADLVKYGIEISQVQVMPDFKLVQVFWCASGASPTQIKEITEILNVCAYKLRHELSQLKVIGIVPPIIFCKDKVFSAMKELDKVIAIADYGEDYTPTIPVPKQPELVLFTKLPNQVREKVVKSKLSDELEVVKEDNDNDDDLEIYTVDLPPMRHDVLNVDHFKIMSKIKIAMNKPIGPEQYKFGSSSNMVQRSLNSVSMDMYQTENEFDNFEDFLRMRNIAMKKMREVELRELKEEEMFLKQYENENYDNVQDNIEDEMMAEQQDETNENDKWF